MFQSALERTPAERPVFLSEACAGDPALQSEVESLAAWHDQAGTFIQDPLVLSPPPLASGDRLGPYEIVRLLGSGGMGDVYLARDPRLEREVALKLLSLDMAADQERAKRLLREARALSALSHPNICTIYDINTAEGRDYICFEYIQGQRLDAMLADGGLTRERLLELALLLAEALAYAHGKGVLHRDLKPANIMVSDLGTPKVLDFGLAKVLPRAGRAVRESTSDSAETGLMVGTAAYMSPEQALGRKTDERSDIFSFGVVLYEMATGRCAFAGTTAMQVLDAVLHAEPEAVATVRRDLPAELSLVVMKALAKDPSQRYQHMSDLATDLRRLQGPASAAVKLRISPLAKALTAVSGPRARAMARLAAVTLFAAVAFAAGRWLANPPAPVASIPLMLTSLELPADAPLALGTSTPNVGVDRPVIALSPDGRLLAYVGQSSSGTKLYLRDLAAEHVTPLGGTEGVIFAFFSPDGRWLGFLTDDKVKKLPVTGGLPLTLCNAYLPGVASWLRDDSIYFSEALDKRISRVSAAGGAPTVVSDAAGFSSMLPDGKRALLNPRAEGISHDYADVSLLSLETGESKIVLRSGYAARYVEPGYLVFARGGNLFAVGFDAVRGEVSGSARLIASDAMMESVWGQAQVTVSDTGVMAYVPGGDRSVGRLAWVDREGHTEFLPTPAGVYGVVRVSPDGRRLAAHVSDVNDYVWIHDVARGESRRLTASEHSGFPSWGPDGLTIAFAAWQSFGRNRLVLRSVEGGALQELLPQSDGYPTSVSASGSVALNTNRSWISIVRHDGHVDRFDMGGRMATVPDFSPDGRFVAYAWHESGEAEVYVRSYPDGQIIRQVSADGGIEPQWCRCGQLFYRKANRWMSVKIRTEPELQWEPAQPAFRSDFVDAPGRSYDVTPDGKRLLIVKREQRETRNRVNLLISWPVAVARAERSSRE